jgi:transglutaminase-like putative cysteine protease
VASGLSGDAVYLRNWVRNNIGYNSNWGGDDPVWYGLKNRTGNCYVHAKCLDALLKAHGYETQLIWVTDKSHYWNLVKIDGQWKHLDSTPGSRHSKYYQPMNDEQRYSCLQGRDWDRTQWPACP